MSSSRDADGRGGGRKLSRRGFLKTVGVGTAGAAAASSGWAAGREAAPEEARPEEMARVALRVNGRTHRLLVEPRWSLLFVLREKLGLTGAKPGCDRGECGACTVLLDGVARLSCLTLALEAQGAEVTTVEGLLEGERLGPVQRAFVEQDAYQCGYCTPGQVMAVEGLLRANPEPSLEDVRHGLSGNLCRCGAYPGILRAARRAAELRREEGAS